MSDWSDLREHGDLERQLREALAPVEPPAGFAERLERRLRERERRRVLRTWRGAVAAVLLLCALVGGWAGVRRREEQRVAERAVVRAQFNLAMQITSRSLGRAGRGLRRLSTTKGEVE